MSEKFDFEEALKALKSGQAITGKDGVLAPLIKQLTEAALEGEIESHIANDVVPNRRMLILTLIKPFGFRVNQATKIPG